MSYPVAPILSELSALKGPIDNGKKNGTYNAQHWDGEVEKILNAECARAEHNVSTSNQVVQVQRDLAKKAIDMVETILKKKELTKEDLQYIEHVPGAIQQSMKRISDDLQDLMHANGEYRAGWPAVAKELLSPNAQGAVAPFVANRTKQIDGQAAVMALKKRVEEYLPRAQEFVKQAKQRASEGKVEVEEFRSDTEAIKKKMEVGRDAIKELHAKKARAIAAIKEIEKTKTWSADQSKNGKSWLGEVCANAKNARGQLKTLDVLFEGLKNRGKAAGPGWKDLAAKAISEAEKPLKEARDGTKAFDADEEKCKKICKDHGVTV